MQDFLPALFKLTFSMDCWSLLAGLCILSTPAWGQSRFNCPALPPLPRPARNVYELRPQDIKVVMALGDSVTAGFAMMGSHGVDVIADASEYRGQSWCIGMDEGAQTVPNFLRTYTTGILGGSLGHHFGELCYDIICPPYQYRSDQDVFNAAQSGAMVANLVSHEFSYLLDQLKKNKNVDMENDWKLLTLFIGGNDICLGCSGDIPTLTADDYDHHLREVLKEVETKIPKVFVNLVLMGNLSEIYTLSLRSKYCSDVHRIVPIECYCAFKQGKSGNKTRLEMDNMASAINIKMKQIAADYVNKSDTFAVVVQPFMSGTKADHLPLEYLSTFDCFHPSLLAHQSMAVALWNNMITPAADKQTMFTVKDPAKCPTNMTLLYTY